MSELTIHPDDEPRNADWPSNRRFSAEMRRAEQYAAEEMGWEGAEAVDAQAAGRGGRAVAVLIDPGVEDNEGRFVVAFDEAGRIVTDAGVPAEFGWTDVEMF